MSMNRLLLSLTAVLTGIVMANPALAYIGPGAGLSAIGTVVAVIGAVLLLVVGFVWYPVRRLLRKGKANEGKVEKKTADPPN